MSPEEQKDFVHNLSFRIAESIASQIDAGLIPPEWDSLELRLLLSYRYNQEALTIKGNITRKHRVRNTIIVNNL